MLQMVEPTLRAMDEIAARNMAQPLTPEGAYQLTLTATNNKQLALNTKIQLALNSMPEPKLNRP